MRKIEKYVCAGLVEELSERCGKLIRVGDEEIVLFRVGAEIVAVTNVCPHQHFARLHEGEMKNGLLTCPMHGWTFDLRTGEATRGSGKLRKHEVRLKDNQIWIQCHEE